LKKNTWKGMDWTKDKPVERVIQVSDSNVAATTSSGVNPAGEASLNPFLKNAKMYDGSPATGRFMAEEATSSSNAWIMAAIASAVTGVALLSLSKKSAVTAVPV